MKNVKQKTNYYVLFSIIICFFFVVFFNHRPLFNNWGSIDFFFSKVSL